MKLKIKKRRPSEKELLAKIITGDHPVLKEKCGNCPPEMFESLVTGLCSVLVATKTGVGLAAPQIGIPTKAFAVKRDGIINVFFNPEITSKSLETETAIEGCLSYPNIWKDIERHTWIQLKYTDENGVAKNETFIGFTARIIQHEYDHLQGVCRVAENERK